MSNLFLHRLLTFGPVTPLINYNKSLRFPNTTTTLGAQYLLPTNGSFTIEAWFNIDYSNPAGYIDSQTAQYFFSGTGIRCLLRPGSVDLTNINNNTQITSTTGIPANTWTHLRVMYDADLNIAKIYFNNVEQATIYNNGTLLGNFGEFLSIDIGYISSARQYNSINGLVAQLRVWPYARTVTQNNNSWNKAGRLVDDLDTANGAWEFLESTPVGGVAYYADSSGCNKFLDTTSHTVENTQEDGPPALISTGTAAVRRTHWFDTMARDMSVLSVKVPGFGQYMPAGSYTIEFTAFANAATTNATIFLSSAPTNRINVAYLYSNGNTYFDSGNISGAGRLDFPDPIFWPNRYVHCAVVVDTVANKMRWYANGRLFAEKTGYTIWNPSNVDLLLGDGNGKFPGKLGEVRVWDHARSQVDIQANLNMVLDGPVTGLLGCWRMTDSSNTIGGQILDRSGNNRHGVLYGLLSQALYMPGTGNSLIGGINVAYNTPTSLTYELKFKIDPAITNAGVFVERINSCLFRLLPMSSIAADGFKLAWYNYNNGNYRIGGPVLYPDIVYHTAVTFDSSLASGNVKLFINGSQVAVFDETQVLPAVNSISLGGFQSDGGVRFTGSIDNFRAWNYARSAAQISANFNTFAPESTTGLIALHGFNGTEPNFVPDESPVGQNWNISGIDVRRIPEF